MVWGTFMLRVLIVDDCKDGADSLSTLLRLWGHEVQVAYDGPAALRLAAVFRPEVLLVDLGLPGMDGCCLARQFLTQAQFRDAILTAVTGYADRDHRTLGSEAGFDAYLVKPTDLAALQAMLSRRTAES